MAIQETTIGHSRFRRQPIETSRVISEPETRFLMGMSHMVEITPPDSIFYSMRRKMLAATGARTLIGEEINENRASLSFPTIKLPLGFVRVEYSYVDDAEPEAELASQRPGFTVATSSEDGNQVHLDIRQVNGGVERFTVPTRPLVEPQGNIISPTA